MRLIRNASIYLLSGVLNEALVILIFPILTRYLSPDEYGHVALFSAFLAFATPVIGMNTSLYTNRSFFRLPQEEVARDIGNSLLAVAFNALVVLAALGAYAVWRDELSGLENPWIVAVIVMALATAAYNIFLTVLRNRGRAVGYGAFQFGNLALNLGLSVLFVVGFGLGWQGRAGALAICATLTGAVGFILLRRLGLCDLRPDGARLRDVYRVSAPLVPHAMAAAILSLSSRVFLDALTDKTTVGLYAVGTTLGGVVMMVNVAFVNAWSPWVYRVLGSGSPTERDLRRIVASTWLYVGGLIGVAAVVTVLSPWLLSWLATGEYEGAVAYVGWAAVAAVFQGAYMLLVPYFVHVGRTGALAVGTVTASLACLVLNAVLIPWLGPLGAVYALAAASAVKLLLVARASRRVYSMPWLPWVGRGGEPPR